MISIVIPVFNRAELVKRTLESIAAQSVRPDAVILVDNGSTDGTEETLRAWARGKDWAMVVSESRRGAAAARNRGLGLVESDYVMFFDSDDTMGRRHVEEVTAGLVAAGRPEIGAFDMELTGVDGRREMKRFREGDAMFQHIFHSTLSTQRCVVSTSLARKAGGWDESLPSWNDFEFGVRLLATGAKPAYLHLSEPPHAYAQIESITGTDFGSKAGEWERALDACSRTLAGTGYEVFIDYRRAILAGHYMGEGRPDAAAPLMIGRSLKFRMISRYVAAGGRGVAYVARLLR